MERTSEYCGLFENLLSDSEQRKLVDKLREIGLDKYVELPQIAVMGDTSSGKSSLLSALSGVSFPSADQLTTRCPTQLILTNADTFRGNVRLVRFRPDEDNKPTNEGEERESLNCLEDVPGAITKFTQKLVDEGQYISDDQIVIEMSGPELPNLTLTDLPGLVRTVGDHENQSIIPRVRQMVDRYMRQERTVIIAVVPANVDMHNTEILQAAQEADPNGTRTIAVVTKIDLVDAGAEDAVHELLKNKKKFMHLGYHAVKCRNQRELTEGTTIEKGIANEMAFFGQHEYWRRLSRELWGVPRLTDRLVSILQDNIRRSLPKVIAEINARMAGAQQELSSLGIPLESLGEQRQQLGRWVNQFLRRMEAAMNGEYDLLGSGGEIQPRLRSALRENDIVFRKEIESAKDKGSASLSTAYGQLFNPQAGVAVGDSVVVDCQETVWEVAKTKGTTIQCKERPGEWIRAPRWQPVPETSSGSLKQFIRDHRGDELAIFPSYRVFSALVQRTVNAWEQPAMKLLNLYHSQMSSVSHRVAAMVLANAESSVPQFFNSTANRVLGSLEQVARQELKLLLQQEARPYTQDQGLFTELDKLRHEAFQTRLEAILPPANTSGLVSRADVIQALGGVSMGVFSLPSDDREELEMEIALRAYLDVATHRVVDVVPMKLNGLLVTSFLEKMESALLLATTDEKVAELMKGAESNSARRQEIREEINTLEEAKNVVSIIREL